MDAQYPFASRDDIWRVFEELKELHATQLEQAERIARLERRRDEDAKLKSVWGPLSPFPTSVAGTIPTGVFTWSSNCFRIGADLSFLLQSLSSIRRLTPSKVSIRDSITGLGGPWA